MNSKSISLIPIPEGYFVQQPVAQLPSIEAIERELQGFDGGDV